MIDGPYKLPEGWRWVRLGEACQINPRRPSLDVNPTTEVTFVPMSAVDAELGIIYTPEIKPFSAVKTGYTYFEENDVLFAKITPCMENGKSAVARGLLNNIGFGSTEFHVLRPIDSVLSEWIWLYVRKKDFRESARAAFRGGVGQQRVPAEFLQEACIPLPPLNEQRRIVAKVEMLMEQVREARCLRQKAVEDTDRLWQAVLADTFPCPGTDLPPNWRWVRLGEICEYKTGIWGPEASDPKLGFPIVRSTEIDGMFIRPEKASIREIPRSRLGAYALKSGDILVNKSSGSPRLVGWPALFEGSKDGRIYLFSNFMLRLRVKESVLMSHFLLYYLHSPIARSIYLGAQDTTSGLRNLRVRDFMNQSIPLAPFNEQQGLITHLERTHKNIKSLMDGQAQFGAELQRLEQSILDSAFKGEL
jgi:type I restriction enzyme S subunit